MKVIISKRVRGAATLVGVALLIALLSACERAAPPIVTTPGATLLPPPTAVSPTPGTNPTSAPTTQATTVASGPTVVPAGPTTAGTTAPAATATRASAVPTATARPAVATPTAAPAAITPTFAPFPPNATGRTMSTKIFLVALNDNGATGTRIGCNDSIVGVTRLLPASTSPLTDTTKDLVALRSKFYGQSGLYNVFYQSRLVVDSVILVNGKATIRLRGTLALSGECDDPRLEAQLKYTALQYSTVKSVEIIINNKTLSSVLGGGG